MKLGRWESWVTLVAALGVVLVLVNMVLVGRNRTLQAEVNARAQYIQQTARVEGLHRELINAIANLAVRNKDDALRTILTQHGITFNPGQVPVGGGPPSAPAPEKDRR
jgi:ABC-type transport system involved in cytochrome bd biosynthesis fused ATPase/permease subunit